MLSLPIRYLSFYWANTYEINKLYRRTCRKWRTKKYLIIQSHTNVAGYFSLEEDGYR